MRTPASAQKWDWVSKADGVGSASGGSRGARLKLRLRRCDGAEVAARQHADRISFRSSRDFATCMLHQTIVRAKILRSACIAGGGHTTESAVFQTFFALAQDWTWPRRSFFNRCESISSTARIQHRLLMRGTRSELSALGLAADRRRDQLVHSTFMRSACFHSTVTAPNHTKEVQAMVRVRCGVRHSATTRNTL